MRKLKLWNRLVRATAVSVASVMHTQQPETSLVIADTIAPTSVIL